MKFGFILFFACWQLAAQPSYQVYTSGGFKGLKNPQGEVVIPPVYDELGWSNGETKHENLIGYLQDGKWGLISSSNKKITEPQFDKVEPFSSGRFRVGIKGKFTNRFFYGLINDKGKIILNLDYFELLNNQEAILVTTYKKNKFLMGSLKPDLSRGMDVKYLGIEVFGQLLIGKNELKNIDVATLTGKLLSEGLDQVRKDGDFLITTKGGRDGLISSKGELIHPPIHKKIKSFDRVTTFANWEIRSGESRSKISADSVDFVGKNLWLVHRSGTSQFHSGNKESIPGSYHLKQLLDGFAILESVTTSEWIAVDSDEELILKSNDSIHFNGKFFYVKENDTWSIHNRLGVRLSVKYFDKIFPQMRRYQPVKKFNYWAVLDGIEKKLTDFRYDSIAHIYGSKAIVQYVKKWGVMHLGQDWLIPPEYDQIEFINGHYLATKGRSHHLLNTDGRRLYKTIDIIRQKDDYFILTYENKYGALNESGRPIANTSYDAVTKWETFYELNKNYVDLFTNTGKKILDQGDQIQDVLAFTESHFLIKKNNNFGFVGTQGNLRIANRYDSARAFSEGLAAVKLRGMWGFIDKAESLVIQPHYQWVSSFSNGLAIFKSHGHYGLLDPSGRQVLAANYLSISKTKYSNFLLQSKNQTYSLANANGIIFLAGRYEKLKDLGNSMVMGVLSGKKGLLNYQGKTVINFEFEEIVLNGPNVLLKNWN